MPGQYEICRTTHHLIDMLQKCQELKSIQRLCSIYSNYAKSTSFMFFLFCYATKAGNMQQCFLKYTLLQRLQARRQRGAGGRSPPDFCFCPPPPIYFLPPPPPPDLFLAPHCIFS